jgi:glutathione S-transferase
MRLYSEDTSPWCAPVRAAIYAKGLDIEIAPPPGGLKSEEYRTISVTGTIPCLMLEDGAPLPESMVILGYLDERFAERPLRPADAEGRARVALIQRLSEGGLLGPLVQLYHDLAAGRADAKGAALEALTAGLARLEAFGGDGFAAGPAFTLADCVLAPALFGVIAWGPGLGDPGLVQRFPKLAAYAGRAMAHPAIARVLDELRAALAASGTSLG